MNKNELARALSDKCDVTIKFAEELTNNLFGVMYDTLCEGESISIFGFGNFKVVNKPERIAHNPSTMEKVVVPAHNEVKFKPCSSLKEDVK